MNNIVIDDPAGSNPIEIARRPYDATQGDERAFDFGEALLRAEARATESGNRQVVTANEVALADQHIIPRYVIQAL